MWDEKAFALVAQLAEAASRDHGELLERIRAIAGEGAAHGVLRSGRFVALVEDACKGAVPGRVAATWTRFRDGLSEAGVEYSEDLAPRITTELRRILPQLPADIREELSRTHQQTGVVGQEWLQASLRDLARLWQQCVDGLEPEVGVWCAGRRNAELRRAAQTVAASTQHFHAPVGSVQIGNQNTATVQQNLVDDEVRRRLLEALDQVEAGLRSPGVKVGRKDELAELVAEAKAEASKPQPKWLRLKSLAGGVSDGIRTVAALRGAYEVLDAVVSTAKQLL